MMVSYSGMLVRFQMPCTRGFRHWPLHGFTIVLPDTLHSSKQALSEDSLPSRHLMYSGSSLRDTSSMRARSKTSLRQRWRLLGSVLRQKPCSEEITALKAAVWLSSILQAPEPTGLTPRPPHPQPKTQ